MNAPVTFTQKGALAGARRTIPLALAAFAFGAIFGVLARQTGLTLIEAALMSTLVFAGASQFIALGLWAAPLPVAAIILTTLVVNLRHVLMGAALYPWFSRISCLRAYTSAHFMVDESWALAMRELRAGGRDAAFLLGSGLVMFLAWPGGSVVGHALGAAVQDPAAWGLDFVFTAVFVALLVGIWKGRSDLLPWGVAAAVAVITSQLLPETSWYILAGGIAGSLVGAWRDDR
jgi:4-azaleucine resistance transporter AzlC